MRIADKMAFEQVKSSIGKNRTDMAELQNQAATQKRLTKPSDDPLSATRILQARTEINTGAQFIKSINQAKTFLEYSDQSLAELSEVLVRAKELAISQSNDASADESTRRVTATEVQQLFSQAVQVGNRKIGDRFLFGGFKTTRPPFDPNGNYRGDSGEIKISIDKEASVAMNVPGDRVFLGRSVQAPRSAGPQTAPGTPPGTPQQKSNGSSADEPVILRGPAGEKLPVVEQDEFGAMKVDNPENEEIPVATNLGESWNTQGISVFKVLSDLETALRVNDKATIQESMDSLDEAISQVVISRSQLGARSNTLNSSVENLTKGQVETKSMASQLEDADTFELVSDINKTESTLKASLATSGKLIQPSLLDFLR
ncbi:MAG: flagellar hook-associated protein FlgL [Bdellovibrionota bacterium]